MAARESKYNGLISAVIFVAMEVAAIVMLSRTSSLENIWINRFSHRVLGTLWQGGESVRNYFSLERQNEALAEENRELSQQVREYRQREQAYLGSSPFDSSTGNFRFIPATIVKASRNSQHNYIILDKGRADGVEPESGIITGSGVVGIVKAVDEHLCYGLTLMNPNVKVSTRAGRSGVVSAMEWDGKSTDKAIMKDIPLHYDFEKGDTLWTSGFSTVFPPDLPLGTIRDVKLLEGRANVAEIDLFQDFATIRYVSVVRNLDRESLHKLEETALSNDEE